MSKRNISAEKHDLYGKLSQFQKIREITAGHLYQGLGQSPQSFLMFVLQKKTRNSLIALSTLATGISVCQVSLNQCLDSEVCRGNQFACHDLDIRNL